MHDPVYDAFLGTLAEDISEVNAASDILHLAPYGDAEPKPHVYAGWLRDVEHLVPNGDGTASVSADPVAISLRFPPGYCRSTDPNLQFRVAEIHSPLLHPNVRGLTVCLGPHFRPGTRVRPLVQQLYGIVCGRIRATDHAFDAEACRYYLHHLDQVLALRARPLWRRRVVGRTRIGSLDTTNGMTGETP